MSSPNPKSRIALLGKERIVLLGTEPRSGEKLLADFELPAAWRTSRCLKSDDLRRGWVVVSTLPNIKSNACSSQILDLEEGMLGFQRRPLLFHVSADAPPNWREVGEFHPTLRSPGYTLSGANGDAFALAFGVAVSGHRRIAHGLFALLDGVFVVVEIPHDQMTTPPVRPFLEELKKAM